MEKLLKSFIANYASKHEIVFTILSAIGMLRLLLKPLMVFLHKIVDITPSDKDNLILQKFEGSKWFKYVEFLVDYLFSLKIRK